jgi:hypothetical protein
MFDLTFEIGGRNVNPDQIGDALDKAIFQQIVDNMKKFFGSVWCSEHGQRPSVKVKGKDFSNLSSKVAGCCQAIIDKATEKLK